MRMRWAGGFGAWVVLGWLSGCGPFVLPEGETESESEDASTSTPPPGGTTTSPPPPGTTTSPPPPPPGTTTIPPSDESTSGDASTSYTFIIRGDVNWADPECDLFAQDCPPGDKCIPWANDGGSTWNSLRCSPIADDPDGVGEPCTVEGGPTSGLDSCGAGMMCWDVDPETNAGHCVAFCAGDEANPMCEDPGTTCILNNDGVLALCLPDCSPLQQDCPAGEGCYPVADAFVCAPDSSGEVGVPGDACEYINVCDPGSFCAGPETVGECMGAFGCCSSFCDLTVDPPPCLPGQECLPWYEPGQAPPGYENVGACALPM